MKNYFTQVGNNSDKSSKQYRPDSLSLVSRQSVLAILLVLMTVFCGNAWGATTYKLTAVTSVSAGNKYVFVEDGYAFRGVKESDALQTTNSYNTTGLSGSETYVWTLEAGTEPNTSSSGFYIRNCSTTVYIRNSTSTTITLPTSTSNGTTTNMVWTFAFKNGTATITCIGSGRYLGETGTDTHAFKAYSAAGYTKEISVYRLDEECANSVTISKGTSTNCTFTLSKSGSQASCDGVTTTISITPTTGYGTPVVTQSGASSAPTPGGSGNTQTLAYAANTTGTSTINVSCSANNYTITLNTDLTATTAGTTSITATYNDDDNLTSAITKPTKTGWTFGGYYTAKSGGGTQIIDADGNILASKTGYTDASKNWKLADNLTLYAKWTCTVTWSVNALTDVYDEQTVTYNSTSCKVSSVPTPSPGEPYCGDKFMGWTTEENVSQNDDTGLDLFTTVGSSPTITGDITFYAVFADYAD